MSAFLYFVAGLNKPVELTDLPGLGLAYAFEETPQCSPISGRTPSGVGGMLIWSQSRIGNMMPAYNPDLQTWRKIPGREGHFVGFYTANPPTPAALRRAGGLPGQSLALGDGNDWEIPRLTMFGGESGFTPAYSLVADLDDDGNWISGGAASEATAAKELFDRLYEWMIDPEGVPTQGALDSTCDLLSINYVISRVEAAALRLLKADQSLHRALVAAMDWDTVTEWTKKKMQTAPSSAAAG